LFKVSKIGLKGADKFLLYLLGESPQKVKLGTVFLLNFFGKEMVNSKGCIFKFGIPGKMCRNGGSGGYL